MGKAEMMGARYYTPTIEEFHVGFEYELFEDFDTLPEKIWHKQVYGINGANPEQIDHVHASHLDKVRVKLLDHDDIVKCGWEEWCKDGVYEITDKDKRYWQLHMDRYLDREDGSRALDLYEGVTADNTGQSIVIYCKNKSELKVLMKQLGIT